MPTDIHLPPSEESTKPSRVLLVATSPSVATQLQTALPDGVETQHVTATADAIERLSADDAPDCVVCDQQHLGEDASDFLDRLRSSRPELPVVLLTDDDRMDAVADAVRDGVDFLPRAAAAANPELLAEAVRDSLEHFRLLELLAESRERHHSLVGEVLDEAVAGIAIYDADGTMVWCNQELETLFGIDAEAYVGRRLDDDIRGLVEDLFEDPESAVEAYERAAESDEETETELHVLPGPDRAERWVIHRTRPIATGLYEGGWVSTFSDVTDRKRREQMLTALHRSTRELMRAESRAEVAAGVVEAATEVLGLSSVVVYYWDEHENSLRPVEWSDDIEQQFGVAEPPDLDGPSWLGWQAFVDGTTAHIDDLHDEDTPFEGSAPFRSGLIVPIGEFGLLASGAERPGVYTDTDIDFAETLAANATAALERDDFERRLRTQAAALDDRSDELRRADRTNRLVRGVDRALVDASTRQEVERSVCRVIADVEPYDFVWVEVRDDADEPFTPRAWAGDDHSGFLDELRDCLPADDSFPTVDTIETGEPQAISDLLTERPDVSWRQVMLSHGFNSTAAIPLSYRGIVYGSIGIASEQGDPFDDRAVSVLREVGANVANAIVGVTRKNALLGVEHTTELEFELRPTDGCGVLLRVADRFDTRVTVSGLVPSADETYHAYLSVQEVTAERVIDHLDDTLSARSARVVRESDDACLVETAVTDLGIMGTVTDHGATVRSVEASGDTGRLRVGVPPATETRAIVNTVREDSPAASLVALRESTTEQWLQSDLFSQVEDSLTDRQRDVLRATYYGGYFDWPREQTGEELAAKFDISSPTFHQHLREAMRRLLATVYESRSPDDET